MDSEHYFTVGENQVTITLTQLSEKAWLATATYQDHWHEVSAATRQATLEAMEQALAENGRNLSD